MEICCTRSSVSAIAGEKFTFEVFDSIHAIPENQWIKLIPDANTLLQPAYLALLEETQRGQMEFIYTLVKKEGGVVGLCYFQVVHFSGMNLVSYFPTKENKWLQRIMQPIKNFIGRIDVPLLVSGNLFITGEKGFYFLSHYNEEQKSILLTKTIAHIMCERPYLKAVLLPNMYAPATEFDKPLLSAAYRKIFVEADMEMELPTTWHSFDDYLLALTSKYRVRAKKILSHASVVDTRELTYEEVVAQQDEIFALYQTVADKALFNIARFSKDYFAKQKKMTPDTYHIIGYYIAGKLVGFMSLFQLSYRTEVHYAGINYEYNKSHSIYQYMLYDIIRLGIEKGVRKLHFGRTAPEVKSTIGAVQAPMYGYLKHRNWFINWIMQLFTTRLHPRDYKLRRPFK